MKHQLRSDPIAVGPADDGAMAYRLFHDLPFIGMAVTSATTQRWVQVNAALCAMLGYAHDDLIEKTWVEVTHPEDLNADLAEFQRVIDGVSDGYKQDKRFIRADGAIVYASIDVRGIRTGDGSIDFLVATVYDITARVEAERAARRSAALLENLGRQVPGVIYQYLLRPDGTSCFPFASEAIREIYEVAPDEVIESASVVIERIHPDDLAMVIASIDESAATLQPWRCDYRVVLPRQGVRWLRGDARPERLGDGSTLWHGFISDSTERQLEREALMESEERYRVQIEHAPEAIMVYDVDRQEVVDVNTNAEKLFGLTRDQLLGRNIRTLGAQRQADGSESAFVGPAYVRRALAGEVPVFEWLHLHASGREIPCEVRLVKLPAVGRSLVRGSMTDITERKRSAEALTRLEAAISASINGTAIADLEGTLLFVNRALLDLWGYEHPDQVLGRSVVSFWLDPDEPSRVVEALHESGAWTGEMTALHADGIPRLFQVNASLFPDASGRPAGMLASFADITERRRTEEALRVRDEAIRTAITAIAICDPNGKPVYVNPAFVRLWGYGSDVEVLGRAVNDFLSSSAASPRPKVDTLFTTGAWQGEMRARRKDDSEFDILAAINVVRAESGAVMHLMGSFVDITESKRLQAEVLQAQKMESVGRLAGGVAHDFNNLLTVMKGCLDLALDSSQVQGVLRTELEEINRAADSAADLTRQLLAFSRKQIIAPRTLDLNDVVHRVHGMLLRLLGGDIRLQVVTAPGLGAVRFDPGQAEQILVNLAVNARDAMPSGGQLTVETCNVSLDEEYARAHPGTMAGDYVLLAVSDTGLGMTADTRAHIFEPFFTTKEVGQGTGLGLAMIHGAVSQNGGRVEVYSEVGHGTSFKIFLPRVADPVTPTAVPAASTLLPRGAETIVLVEDDQAVRTLVVRLLERQGYRVFSFSSGAAVLDWMAEWTEPIHLLLTDVIMPGMNGRMLAERVRTLRPETRVLYASGYTANVIVQHGVLKPGVEFLAKPFTAAALATTVRELLDRP